MKFLTNTCILPLFALIPCLHRFIFSVETNGSIDAEEVVVQALEVLSAKLQTLRNELINIKQ